MNLKRIHNRTISSSYDDGDKDRESGENGKRDQDEEENPMSWYPLGGHNANDSVDFSNMLQEVLGGKANIDMRSGT